MGKPIADASITVMPKPFAIGREKRRHPSCNNSSADNNAKRLQELLSTDWTRFHPIYSEAGYRGHRTGLREAVGRRCRGELSEKFKTFDQFNYAFVLTKTSAKSDDKGFVGNAESVAECRNIVGADFDWIKCVDCVYTSASTTTYHTLLMVRIEMFFDSEFAQRGADIDNRRGGC